MPVYDYLCARCGAFTDMRPMAEAELPQRCPACGKRAPRAFLTAPYLARGSSAPRAPASANAHGGGCSCCSRASMRYDKSRGAAAKGRSI